MKVELDVFRETLLEQARREAEEELEAAENEAAKRLAEAREQAEQLGEQARREGREAAERETRRERVEARREARALVLREQRRALERLRERALERVREARGSDAYRRLTARLEQRARRQLGDDVEIDNADGGGLVGHCDGRRVDYRLPVLVDRVIEEMGSELEGVWK